MIDPPLYLCWLAQQLASEMFKAVMVVVYESKIKDLLYDLFLQIA